jgi:uncharacterized membrane protein
MSMGMPGGCNPIPLKATVTGDSVLITRADLAVVAPHFRE